ncbi:Uncharacterised protein [Mycobacteroides abscessus]|nr:Uncharacterised protein [Mycobacteroides abscessus]SIN07928.1 Uncharacterised protein [Mycobacteroides abscessus subsp. abscessus]
MPVEVTAILHPGQPGGKQHLPLSERGGKSRLIRRIVLEFGGHAAQRAPERASGDFVIGQDRLGPAFDALHRVDLRERGLRRQDQLGLTFHDRLY